MKPGVRDVSVLASRILMSTTPIWIIVEGRYHDRAYYDRLLNSIPSIAGLQYEILLAEYPAVDEVAAGGKKHALKLHAALSENGWLRQRSKKTNHIVIFSLDKDLDDEPTSNMPDDLHILYTKYADVEAEILQGNDLIAALTALTGASKRDLIELAAEAHNPLQHISEAWAEWHRWGLALRNANPNALPIRSAALINVGQFGPLDESARVAHLQRVKASVGEAEWGKRIETAHTLHAELVRSGKSPRLVAGKWAAKYVIEAAKRDLSAVGIAGDLDPADLTRVMLMTISFSNRHKQRYEHRMLSLLATT